MLKQHPPLLPTPAHPSDSPKNQKSPKLCSPWAAGGGGGEQLWLLPQGTEHCPDLAPPKNPTGTQKAPWRKGRVDSNAAFPQHMLIGARDCVLGARFCAPRPPRPGMGSAKGNFVRRRKLCHPPLARVFSYCSQGCGFSSAGASRQRCRHPFCRLVLPRHPLGGMGRFSQDRTHLTPGRAGCRGAVYCKTAQILC